VTTLGKARAKGVKSAIQKRLYTRPNNQRSELPANRSHRPASFGDDTSIGPTRAKRKPDAES